MTKIRSICVIVFMAIFLSGCKKEGFNVDGVITQATDSILYFEHIGIDKRTIVDSIRLDSAGAFHFFHVAKEYPDFYRLRISNRIINLSADSATSISVYTNYPLMSSSYEVIGSKECLRIRDLSLLTQDLQRNIALLDTNKSLSHSVLADSIDALINEYKEFVWLNYIISDPASASSYFALFQTLNGHYIFSPRSSGLDLRAFAAVATSWDTFFEGSERTINLHNITMEGMKNAQHLANLYADTLDPNKIVTAGIIDINLKDNHNLDRSLSDLVGKVVMLDFHLFSSTESPQRIILLRELYEKYHSRGFEIYQVALDSDEHFWKLQTSNLPWICVLAPGGINSSLLSTYNVRSVPEFFLIDRTNTLVCRSDQVEDVEKAVSDLLNE